MKKAICFLIIVLFLASCMGVSAYAEGEETFYSATIVPLRAGGGSSGGGGGGGGGGSSGGSSSHHSSSGRPASPLETLVHMITMPIILFASSIVFYIKLSKRSRKAKKLMKQMTQSDNAWKFKEVSADVADAYMAIQEAWANMDMTPAKRYMSDELFDKFQTQLNWTKYKNQKHVMKNIQLLKALPVAVHDDRDNSRDYVWFYIKGKMIDYTIDTNTQLVIEGTTAPASFVEYWQFIRKDGRWVLHKILQKDEENQIPFTE